MKLNFSRIQIFTTFIILLFGLSAANGREFFSEKKFDHLGIEDGLSQSSVTCLLQDSQGFLWIGTQDGLNRYDGYQMRVYKNDPHSTNSLKDNWVQCLAEDHLGNIWIGTYTEGLFKIDINTSKFTQFKHDPDHPESLPHNQIWSLHADHLDRLWIGTSRGLACLPADQKSFKNYFAEPDRPDRLPNNAINVIRQDLQKRYWIGTFGGGLSLFDPDSGKCKNYFDEFDASAENNANKIKCIYPSRDGQIWIGTFGGGLKALNPFNGKIKRFSAGRNSISGNFILSLLEDETGKIWIGTRKNGLNIYDPKTGLFEQYRNLTDENKSLADSWVPAILRDNVGLIWIGTGNGLNMWNPRKAAFHHITANGEKGRGLSNKIINVIKKGSGDYIWIGTWGGGLNQYFPESGEFRHFTYESGEISNNTVWAVSEDNKNNVWVGTAYGLNVINLTSGVMREYRHVEGEAGSLPENNISALLVDKMGQMWVATWESGLTRYDEKNDRFIPFNLGKSGVTRISHLFEDSKNNIWVGSAEDGLRKFRRPANINAQPEEIEVFSFNAADKNSVSHNYVNVVFEDSGGKIWIGTNGGGLNYYDADANRFGLFTESDGLPNNTVHSIEEDLAGNLWLSTNFGLSKFDPAKKVFTNFDASNGLQSDEFSSASCACGDILYFGGINGVTKFNPGKVELNRHEAPVKITDFRKFNEPAQLDGPIFRREYLSLSHSDYVFSFAFAALDFTNPRKNQYKYKMENFDRDWIFAGNNNEVTYTNLPPGNYTFMVNGTNSDGIWSSRTAKIHLSISPPFWQTWWFRGILLGAIALLLIAAHLYRVASIERQNERLEEMVKIQTRELQQKNNELNAINNRQKKLLGEKVGLLEKLQQARGRIKILSGLLPICANCKSIRDDKGYWGSIENYIAEHSEADFSHGICPSCAKKIYPELYSDAKPGKENS